MEESGFAMEEQTLQHAKLGPGTPFAVGVTVCHGCSLLTFRLCTANFG